VTRSVLRSTSVIAGEIALGERPQREKDVLLAVRYRLVHTDDLPEAGG